MLISENVLKKIFLGIIFLTFFLLLFKNPFSENNLIPNLEPYPDSIHYLNPPISFLEGKGFAIEREGRILKPSVPFLYSASLIPGFIIYRDVRFFYFSNVILAFLGLIFLYKFLEKVLPNVYINLFILFLYTTNYFIFWYPNLPMAENLLLTLYILGLFLLVSKLTPKNAFIAGLIGISFYATKYASVSLTLAYLLSYSLKVLLSLNKKGRSFDIKSILKHRGLLTKNILSAPIVFIAGTSASLLLFFIIDSLIRGNNIFFQLFEHAGALAVSKTSSGSSIQPAGWFDTGYFRDHFLIYLNALLGNQMRFLWDQTPLVPKYLAWPAIGGILTCLFIKQYRFLSLSLIFLIIMPIVAISSFYAIDARYINHVIPTLLIGLGLFLVVIYKFLDRQKLKTIFYLLLIVLSIFYSATNFQRLKYQIALNLKHSETPWYYMSVKNFNSYFQTVHPSLNDKPILITALQPFYIDFFSNLNYKLLPLSSEQEFFKRAEIVWGPNDYSDLIALYAKYLEDGRNVYVTNSALGNEVYLYNGFNAVKANFTFDEVKKGCFDTCNIYKISPKK